MDITFFRFFSLSEPEQKAQPKARANSGELPMLSHRSENKFEEPVSNPSLVDRATAIRPNNEAKTISAVIGSKIRFKGELHGEEDLLIEGHVEGTIDLKGHNLIVGERGVVQANVSAKTITVHGSVNGDLFGEERVAIKSSSKVQGNVKAERVVVEDGAKFKGSIDMDVSEVKTIKPPVSDLKIKRETPENDV